MDDPMEVSHSVQPSMPPSDPAGATLSPVLTLLGQRRSLGPDWSPALWLVEGHTFWTICQATISHHLSLTCACHATVILCYRSSLSCVHTHLWPDWIGTHDSFMVISHGNVPQVGQLQLKIWTVGQRQRCLR